MSSGAFILLLIFALRFLGWGGAGSGRPKRSGDMEVSGRFVVVAVTTIAAVFTAFYLLLETFGPYLDRITVPWLHTTLAILFGLLSPAVLLRCGLPWLAWRLVRHLRHPLPARFVFWFTPFAKRADLAGFAQLLAASYGRHPLPERPAPPKRWTGRLRYVLTLRGMPPFEVGPWAVAALALWAERNGDVSAATRYLSSFDVLPTPRQIPRLARVYAFEALARQAALRGDWGAVALCARLGAGRSSWFYRLLARGHLSGRGPALPLVLSWLIAPARWSNLPLVRALLRSRRRAPVESAATDGDEPVPLRHLRMLQEATTGNDIGLISVLNLALAWQQELTRETQAQLLARGVELEGRNIHETVDSIPGAILSELEELAVAANGTIPQEISENWDKWRDTFVGSVVVQLRSRLFARLEEAANRFYSADDTPPPALLEGWEQWLLMREAAERLGLLMGEEDLATAWYGELRDAAWNGACEVFEAHRAQSVWIGHVMFRWVVLMAERFGDEKAAAVNRMNVAVCDIRPAEPGSRLSRCWQRLRRIPKRVDSILLGHITFVLPVGGTLALGAFCLRIWSLQEVMTGLIIALPVAVGCFALLYVAALRIEGKLQQRSETVPGQVEEGAPGEGSA